MKRQQSHAVFSKDGMKGKELQRAASRVSFQNPYQVGGKELPKQRGIYSEILTTEDTKTIQEVSTYGPPESHFMKFNPK
jgi:hypothetical protein